MPILRCKAYPILRSDDNPCWPSIGILCYDSARFGHDEQMATARIIHMNLFARQIREAKASILKCRDESVVIYATTSP